MTRNERIKELSLERRNLAAGLTWPERTPFLLNPDPAERKRLKLVGWMIALLAFGALAPFQGPIDSWSKSYEARQMRPAMETAMKTGNHAAGTWLALHFRKDYPGLLEQEADAGEPTAMFRVGRLMSRVDHPERAIKIDPSMPASQVKAKGLELMRRAAAAGDQDALQYLIQNGGL
ncbi:hypothetical protein [Paraburkholderia humisilvae]|uniref:Uncharacterized protein n=1 Tax=Paraburkholderia humisilvae TaxID=627669 RepID=A0A6J5DJ72_9BURK|nr:hypothetical protein [Paraburkholderia humisilvae]CAB3754209.1 hypothetical protein LMG29542_02279 [Paraburkholderia humisilvae]